MKFHVFLLVVLCLEGFACRIAPAADGVVPNPTAEECQRHFAQDLSRQQLCLRHAVRLPSVKSVAPAKASMVDPLRNPQVLFGFFDRRFASYNAGQEHMGLDLVATAGTLVHAICDGTVALNKTDRPDIVAAVLVVKHDCPPPLGNIHAYYGHIHSSFNQGDWITAGEVIGTVREWPGNSHLHLGLSRQFVDENWGFVARGATQQEIEGQGWLDPLRYFTAAPAQPVLKRVAPKAPVHRKHRAGDVAGKRRR